MTKPVPPISKFMSTNPHTIGWDQNIAKASEMMSEHGIRHLPVLKGGQIVGLISQSDIRLIETLEGVEPQVVKVADAMTPDPYVVSPEALLDEVAAEMAENKYGSAIIMQNQKVVGIFTTLDALRALDELLKTRLHK